jgi:hypothetical protein
MSDPNEIRPQPHPERDAFEPSRSGSHQPPSKESVKYYVVSALGTGLVLFLLFQQMQISQLQGDIRFLSDAMKKDTETRTQTLVSRMDALESKMELLDSKIAYLQTGLAAAAQKAEAATVKTDEAEKAAQEQKPEEKKICVGPFCLQ